MVATTELPSSPFWRFSLALYARPGAAPACLALQDRDGADVNLLLLGLWLGWCGHRLMPAAGAELACLARGWQEPIVRPLRQVRRDLKQRNAAAGLPWPEAVEHWRGRLAEVELALEQVGQLLLEQAVGPIEAGVPDVTFARDNLLALGLDSVVASEETSRLLDLTFATGRTP
jgi:uncharacterized protein (TIGR02444 family)